MQDAFLWLVFERSVSSPYCHRPRHDAVCTQNNKQLLGKACIKLTQNQSTLSLWDQDDHKFQVLRSPPELCTDMEKKFSKYSFSSMLMTAFKMFQLNFYTVSCGWRRKKKIQTTSRVVQYSQKVIKKSVKTEDFDTLHSEFKRDQGSYLTWEQHSCQEISSTSNIQCKLSFSVESSM